MIVVMNDLDKFISKGVSVITVESLMECRESRKSSTIPYLSRMMAQKKIKPIAKGIYKILSPQESASETVDPKTYIDALMFNLKHEYYIGLLSAAEHYGAAHHRPMTLQVVAPTQIRLAKEYTQTISFFSSSTFMKNLTIRKMNAAGFIIYASPILTVYDLIRYETHSGTLYNCINVIKELAPKIRISDCKRLLKENYSFATIQRLGYLLSKLGFHKLSNQLLVIKKKIKVPVQLSRMEPPLLKPCDLMWHIVDNIDWSQLDDI